MTTISRARRVALCCFAVVALMTAACSSRDTADTAAETTADTTAETAVPAYLFTFDGTDAELAPVPGEQGIFTLTVPITRGNQLVTWFTDRPIRDAGHMSMNEFVDLWTDSGDDSFTVDPPNVAISFEQKTVIATMTDPKIVTAVPDGDESLETTMTLVKGDALEQLAKSGKHLAAHAERAQETTLPGALTLSSVSVFVDDSSGTVCTGWRGCCQTANSVSGGTCTVTKG